MEKVNLFIKELQSCDEKALEEYRKKLDEDPCYSYNSSTGDLNKNDGIDCPECLNKGWIQKVDYNKNGLEHFYLVPCKCMTKRNSKKIALKSGMGDLLKNTIKGFEVTEEFQKKMKSTAIQYIKEDNDSWFVILGQSGSGKTHIASAIANKLMDDGKAVKYVIWNDFINDYKVNFDDKLVKALKEIEVLYIDDLFKGKITEFEVKTLFEIINYRYNNKLKTLITSELMFDELCDIDEAIGGRIKQQSKGFNISISKDRNKNYRLKD